MKRSWMKRKRPRRLSRAGSDPAYLEWVRGQACVLSLDIRAFHAGRIHAHHAGRKPGVAMKAVDDTAIPLCEHHHRCWHDATGLFRGLTKMERFAWSIQAIAATQAAYKARTP